MKHLLWLPATIVLLAIATVTRAQVHLGEMHGKLLDPATGITYDLDAIRAARQTEARQVDILRKQARGFLSKKESTKALPLLLKVLQLEPGNPEIRFYLADIYTTQRRPNDVLQALNPIVYPVSHPASGEGMELIAGMKYVLALLDTGKWEEAVSTYEMSMRLQEKNGRIPMPWSVPCYSEGSGDKAHTLANVHFISAVFDEPGLRCQAHLILGTRGTDFLPGDDIQEDQLRYMLGHLQQAIQSDRRCLDAHFLSGVILSELNRFAEGRQAFAKASKLAPREAQPEIKAAVDKLNAREASKQIYDATHPVSARVPRPSRNAEALPSKASDHSAAQYEENARAF